MRTKSCLLLRCATKSSKSSLLRLLSVVALGALVGAGRCAPADGDIVAGEVTFEDEFDGAAGTSPDASKWLMQVGGDGYGNEQLEFTTDRPENVSLDGEGHLALVARREAFQGDAFTAARLTTQGLFAQQYGRFEARIKVPQGQGIWPAFWMLGDNIDAVPWPGCGEIDIMEIRGQEPQTLIGSVHGPGYSGGAAINASTSAEVGTFADDFHVYAVEWDADRIRYFVDDTLYQTLTPSVLGAREWVFDHPFHVLINLAVGGNFVGDPDASTPFPATMLIDYVRVTAGSL